MKKLLSVLLVLAMVFSLGVGAFADTYDGGVEGEGDESNTVIDGGEEGDKIESTTGGSNTAEKTVLANYAPSDPEAKWGSTDDFGEEKYTTGALSVALEAAAKDGSTVERIELAKDLAPDAAIAIGGGNFAFTTASKNLTTTADSAATVTGGAVTFSNNFDNEAGTVTGGKYAVSVSGGTVVFTGGKYTGGTAAIAVSGGTVAIRGGSFTPASIELSGGVLDLTGCPAALLETLTIAPEGGDKTVGTDVKISSGSYFYLAGDETQAAVTTLEEGKSYRLYREAQASWGKSANNLTQSGDLAAAFAAAKDDRDVKYIRLLADVAATATYEIDGGTFTLDLNGKTISASEGTALRINAGTVTIRDSSTAKTGAVTATGAAAIEVTGGSLTITGGEFTGTDGVYVTGGSLTVTDGSFTAGDEVGAAIALSGGTLDLTAYKTVTALTLRVDTSSGSTLTVGTNVKLPSGYSLFDENSVPAAGQLAGGVYTIAATPEAAWGTSKASLTNYGTLADAITAAATDSTVGYILIYKDLKFASGFTITGGCFTIDLNGRSITVASGNAFSVKIESGAAQSIALFSARASASGGVTFKDSSEGQTGSVTASDSGTSAIAVEGGSVTVESGSYTGGGSAVSNTGDLTISGGTFTGQSGSAVTAGASSTSSSDSSTTIITSGSFITGSENTATVSYSGGTLDLSGLSGANGVSIVNNAEGTTFSTDSTSDADIILPDNHELDHDEDDEHDPAEGLQNGTTYSVTPATTSDVEAKWGASASDLTGSGTLADAIEAAEAENSTVGYIQLQKDITLSGLDDGTLIYNITGGTITIDLNGYTIANSSDNYRAVFTVAAGTVTFSGGAAGTGKVTTTGFSWAIGVASGATAIIASGSYEGDTTGPLQNNGGTVTIQGGSFTNTNSGAGSQNTNPAVLNLSGTMTITGGSFAATIAPAVINAGTLTIHNGTFTAGTSLADGYYPSTAVVNGGGMLTVSGGTFTGGRSALAVSGGTATVTGGTFSGTEAMFGYKDGTLDLSGYGDADSFASVTILNYSSGAVVGTAVKLRDGYCVVLGSDTHPVRKMTQTESGSAQAYSVCLLTDATYDTMWGADANHLTGYGSLAEALEAAAEDGTVEYVRLQKDIDEDSGYSITAGDFTLDLNGNNVVGASNTHVFSVTGGKVTFMDSAGGGSVSASGSNMAVTVLAAAEVTISGGSYTAAGESAVTNGGKLTVTGGTISVTGGNCAIESSGTVTITGGEIRGGSTHAVYNDGGTVDISGGTFTAPNSGVGVVANDSGTMTISGGTIESNGGRAVSNGGTMTIKGGAISASSDTEYSNIDACAVSNYSTLTVEGGTISGQYALGVGDGTATVTGGSFTGNEAHFLYIGGTLDLSEYNGSPAIGSLTIANMEHDVTVGTDIQLPSGYGMTKDEPDAYFGRYLVKTLTIDFNNPSNPQTYYVIAVSAAKFDARWGADANNLSEVGSLADAFEAAEETGSTVKYIRLYEDVTATETYAIYGGTFTLDLNGKTISGDGSYDSPIRMNSGTVTITGSGTVTNSGSNAIMLYGGSLTIANGSFKGNNAAINNNGTLTITGGTFNGNNSAISTSGTLTITGGTFKASVNPISTYGTTTIKGGTFTCGSGEAHIYYGGGTLDLSAYNGSGGTAIGELTVRSPSAVEISGKITPPSGYGFSSDGTNIVTTLAASTNYHLIAEVHTYEVTTGTFENGSVTADKYAAKEGETVTLTISPESGYQLDTLTVSYGEGSTVDTTKVNDTTYTFAMPAGAVTVTAAFEPIPAAIGGVSITVTDASGSAVEASNSVYTIRPGYNVTITVSGTYFSNRSDSNKFALWVNGAATDASSLTDDAWTTENNSATLTMQASDFKNYTGAVQLAYSNDGENWTTTNIYIQYQETISVSIAWGSMAFVYTDGSGWSCAEGANKVTVTNGSDVAIGASVAYKAEEAYNAITGTFDQSGATLGTSENNAATFALTLGGTPTDAIAEGTKIGEVTVTINA